ncbi:MAG: LysM peptidoglycan-binding domain-containing protein [Pseudomonadota bacterium]
MQNHGKKRYRSVPNSWLASALLAALAPAAMAGDALLSDDGSLASAAEPLPANVLPNYALRGQASWLHEAQLGHRRPGVLHAIDEKPADLLQRMRARFSMPPSDDSRTAAQLRWYTRHPDYFARVMKRAEPYFHHIVHELEARKMPSELALLPIVESAFDPFAYSHGRAAGLWQIIPGTGRRFGLKQNWWYDGRRDVLESTRAALDYLEFLARRYDGDYELAVAAYNSGEGTVDRAIRRNKKAGKPTDFWHLKLPRETSAYVPKLLALVDIYADPQTHGITLPHIADEPRIAVVETGGQIDLALAATLAGIDVDTLYRHNPGFNQWATAPDGPHSLVVPIAAAQSLRNGLEQLPQRERMRWARHKVGDGQTLSHIAERYNVPTRTIRDANNLTGTMIRAGQYLMIPTASQSLATYSQSAEQRLSRKQNRDRGGERVEHTVRSGESLWTIARRYGVNTRALAAWNGMAPKDTLSVGKKLVIWTQPGDTTRASGTTVTPKRDALTRKVRYTVRSGDSLSRIASRFRVRIGDITRWNNLSRDRILRPGQKLTMYVDVTRQSS